MADPAGRGEAAIIDSVESRGDGRMLWEVCPRCGTARIGAFRFCRGCGLDYDAARRTPAVAPEAAPLSGPPSTVVAAGEDRVEQAMRVAVVPVLPASTAITVPPSTQPAGLAVEHPADHPVAVGGPSDGPTSQAPSERPPVQPPPTERPSVQPPPTPAPAPHRRSVPAEAMLGRLGFAIREVDDGPTPRYLADDGTGLVAIDVRGDPAVAITITAPTPGSASGTDRTAGSALAAGAVMIGDPPGMADWIVGAVSRVGTPDDEDASVFGDVAVRLQRRAGSPPTFTLTYERRAGRP